METIFSTSPGKYHATVEDDETTHHSDAGVAIGTPYVASAVQPLPAVKLLLQDEKEKINTSTGEDRVFWVTTYGKARALQNSQASTLKQLRKLDIDRQTTQGFKFLPDNDKFETAAIKELRDKLFETVEHL